MYFSLYETICCINYFIDNLIINRKLFLNYIYIYFTIILYKSFNKQ